jgi:hypothetical protein
MYCRQYGHFDPVPRNFRIAGHTETTSLLGKVNPLAASFPQPFGGVLETVYAT